LSGYKAISDYGVIGNTKTVALVAKDGSIDWCCFPDLDRSSIFGRLLDHQKGGCFRITVSGALTEQSYIEETNVLRTKFIKNGAIVTLTDFMPLISRQGPSFNAEADICRIVERKTGQAEVEFEWSPRFDFGRERISLEKTGNDWIVRGKSDFLVVCGLESAKISGGDGFPSLRGTLKLGPEKLKRLFADGTIRRRN